MSLGKPAITQVSQPVSGLANTGSAVKNALGEQKDSNSTNGPGALADEGDNRNTSKKLTNTIEEGANSKNALNKFFGFGSGSKSAANFGQMPSGMSLPNLSQLTGALNETLGNWGNQGGRTPGHYSGDPNTTPGLNGYHFGDLKPIQHSKPNDVEMSSTEWNLVNNHLGRAFANGDKLGGAIKPYTKMDIADGFKKDAFAMSVFAMYHPTKEDIGSGKLDFLVEDKKGYRDFNARFNQLLGEAGISSSEANQTMARFGGVHSLSNLDPRFAVQSVKDVKYLENLVNHADELRNQGNNTAKFTLALHIVNDPGLDFNGVHNRNHGFRLGQLSALKDALPQVGNGSASNVIVGAIQGNNSQTRSEQYLTFAGRQMQEAKADYNLVLNYDSHGSGFHAAMGNGADGSIDKNDSDYFRKIGYENATASSIMLNFNSCHNAGLAKTAAEYVAQGVRARREEMGLSTDLKDMTITGRSTSSEGWLKMDGATNYLTYWDKDGKVQAIHGSQQNDMQTHSINISGNSSGKNFELVEEDKAPEQKPLAQAEKAIEQNDEEKDLIAEKDKRKDLEELVA